MSNKRKNRLVMGTAISLATIAIALDHTKHKLPEPVQNDSMSIQYYESDSSPCSMESPCAMESPCSINSSSPCAIESPCSFNAASPCSM